MTTTRTEAETKTYQAIKKAIADTIKSVIDCGADEDKAATFIEGLIESTGYTLDDDYEVRDDLTRKYEPIICALYGKTFLQNYSERCGDE